MADSSPSTSACNETNNVQTLYKLYIGLYVAADAEIGDDIRYKLLTNCWKPDKSYTFPFVQRGNVQRRFSHNYLETFHPWLFWSDAKQGAYRRNCLLFTATDCVGKGDHQPPGILVLRPLQKVKDNLADCHSHTKHNYH